MLDARVDIVEEGLGALEKFLFKLYSMSQKL